MNFTEEQIKTLSNYEENFRTAVYADWARHPGLTGLRQIYDIYTQTTGDKRALNDNCNTCILRLLQDCGRKYFADKQALIDTKNDAAMVEVSKEMAKKSRKAKK